MFTVTDKTSGKTETISFQQFCEANKDDAELCEDLLCLAVGWGFTVGGGAAPAFEIYRIS